MLSKRFFEVQIHPKVKYIKKVPKSFKKFFFKMQRLLKKLSDHSDFISFNSFSRKRYFYVRKFYNLTLRSEI